MKAYYVKYKMYQCGEELGIDLLANNKEDAYVKAVYYAIPKKEGSPPYSAWVYSVTHRNGKYQLFNTLEGKPY